MDKISIKDTKGNIILANLVLIFFSTETNKSYVILKNNNSVFNEESSYDNLDVFEITKEEHNTIYVSDISDAEWEIVKDTMIKEIFSKI